MIINKINIDKLTKAFELVCPLYNEGLITEALIVGSVAKGTAKEDSDIDIYLINPKFNDSNTQLSIDVYDEYKLYSVDVPIEHYEEVFNMPVINIYKYLDKMRVEFIYGRNEEKGTMWHQLYKDEIFHFMYDYESDSIKKGGEYIEITEEMCDEVN